ncbi:MAG: CDP-glycerol glycerophosphotransferase family protein [Clostridia bacterium]|nr:CDP-glycerol glycerophosphotransferase family protein [Clostridia bacterium]
MKELFYRLFAFFFWLSRRLHRGVDPDLVALISPHNASFNDSLGEVETALKEKGGCRFLRLSHADLSGFGSALRFFTTKAFQLARAKTVFLNDNFMPLGYLDFSDETTVIQLWHAEGAFKRFGLDIDQPPAVRRREIAANQKLTYVICSSPAVQPIYAGAFGVAPEQVLPLGSPRADALLKAQNAEELRTKFDERYPQCAGKRLVLYAPTFREDAAWDKSFSDSFDSALLAKELGEDYALLVRLHPQVHTVRAFPDAVDVTDYPAVNELTLICEKLITDYSSICMDFALLDKPCFFFAPDLERYEKTRSFYFDYRTGVPGTVCETMAELIAAMKQPDDPTARKSFREKNLASVDGGSCARILALLEQRR